MQEHTVFVPTRPEVADLYEDQFIAPAAVVAAMRAMEREIARAREDIVVYTDPTRWDNKPYRVTDVARTDTSTAIFLVRE